MGLYDGKKSCWERRNSKLIQDNCGPGCVEDKIKPNPWNYEGSPVYKTEEKVIESEEKVIESEEKVIESEENKSLSVKTGKKNKK